jgi:hypothetical protein
VPESQAPTPEAFDTQVKTGIYRWFAETTRSPAVPDIAGLLDEPPGAIREAYRRLFQKRVLFLEPDGETIRMAPPFSGDDALLPVGGKGERVVPGARNPQAALLEPRPGIRTG